MARLNSAPGFATTAVSRVAQLARTTISVPANDLAQRSDRLRSIDARRVLMRIATQVHPDRPAHRKRHRDHLRAREGAEQEAVILRAYELDDEALDSREHAV